MTNQPMQYLSSIAIILGLIITPNIACAKDGDMSPTLLIETGPSDNPGYRRMVFVKFLNEQTVNVAYKAYNRSEFIQIDDDTPGTVISNCISGRASTLDEIDNFQKREARAIEQNTEPEIAHFCIKNVNDWEAGNRARYLDPIFDSMPHAARLNK